MLISLTACTSQPYALSKPDDLVPKDTMIMVLKDLTLMESHLQTKYVQLSNYYKSLKLSGDIILNKYRISAKRLESSMVYYGSKQNEMQDMYASILDTLTIQSTMTLKQVPIRVTQPANVKINK